MQSQNENKYMDLLGLKRFWAEQNCDPASGMESLVAFDTSLATTAMGCYNATRNSEIVLKLVLALKECRSECEKNFEQPEFHTAYPVGWRKVPITESEDNLHQVIAPLQM
ncbi:hypothetical protein ACA910_011033 [Epithemia clementina (nom. ined.)]